MEPAIRQPFVNPDTFANPGSSSFSTTILDFTLFETGGNDQFDLADFNSFVLRFDLAADDLSPGSQVLPNLGDFHIFSSQDGFPSGGIIQRFSLAW